MNLMPEHGNISPARLFVLVLAACCCLEAASLPNPVADLVAQLNEGNKAGVRERLPLTVESVRPMARLATDGSAYKYETYPLKPSRAASNSSAVVMYITVGVGVRVAMV